MVKNGGTGMPEDHPEEYFLATDLFDIRDDIDQEYNIIDDYPELVEELTRALEKQIKDGRSTADNTQNNNFSNPS